MYILISLENHSDITRVTLTIDVNVYLGENKKGFISESF